MKAFLLFSILLALTCCKNIEVDPGCYNNIPADEPRCINAVKKAKEDLAKGKLVYCAYKGMLGDKEDRFDPQLKRVLMANDIILRIELVSDVISGKREHCYCGFMNYEIKKKFGPMFIDSLKLVADSLYAFEDPTDTFYYFHCDIPPSYPGTNSAYALQDKFDSIVQYPNGYIKEKNNEDYSFVEVDFYIDKIGKASGLTFRFKWDYKENEKYEPYLKSIITPLFLNTTWQPATVKKNKVMSDMNIRIGFD